MPYQVSFVELNEHFVNSPEFKQTWLSVYGQASSDSFFTSWAWVCAWLKLIETPAYLLEAKLNGETCGIALFTYRVEWRSAMPIKQLWLHKTGNRQFDQMWIEYNDFVVNKNDGDAIKIAMLKYLSQQDLLPWHELHCDMLLENNTLLSITEEYQIPLKQRETLASRGYFNVLNARQNQAAAETTTATQARFPLLTKTSKNTRQQIKRSIKLLEEKGELRLVVADCNKTKQAWLKQLGLLHIEQWRETQWGSGFDNDYFVSFHQDIIEHNQTELLCLFLDERPIAYGYNYCVDSKDGQGGNVYFYLSAIPKNTDNRIKIGLVFHTFSMEHYRTRGFLSYDFLAGDARYKKSLADNDYMMHSTCIYKPSVWLSFENQFRRFKSYIKNGRT